MLVEYALARACSRGAACRLLDTAAMMSESSNYRRELLTQYASTHAAHFVSRDERWYRERARFFEHRLRDFLPPDLDASILDAACGAGELLSYLRGRGYSNVLGLDVSDEQIAAARQAGLDNTIRTELLAYLSDTAQRYDCIIASHVIEHLRKDEVIACLRLAARTLRPRGRLILLTPNAASPLGIPYSFGDFTHEVHFSATSLAQVAALTGFTIVHLGGISPDARGWQGLVRRAVWAALLRPLLQAVLGDRRMQFGRIMEPELIAVLDTLGAQPSRERPAE